MLEITGRIHLGCRWILNVNAIQSDAFFSIDPGVGDVVAKFANRHQYVVEQAQAVNGLEFHHGVKWRYVVIDEDALRHFCQHFINLFLHLSTTGDRLTKIKAAL